MRAFFHFVRKNKVLQKDAILLVTQKIKGGIIYAANKR